MSERWKQYVTAGVDRAGGPMPFALGQWMFLEPVFGAIRRARPDGGRILDVGCGAGIFTSLVAHHGYDITGIDDDPEIVAYARTMCEYFRSPARIEVGNAFDLSPFHGRCDLVYSLGVVEHFDADVTMRLIAEQARCAPVVVVVVPTAYTRYAATPTDERFYSLRGVRRLVEEAGCRVREGFVYGTVPTALARNAERMLPGVVDRWWRRRWTYAMGICCVGERA